MFSSAELGRPVGGLNAGVDAADAGGERVGLVLAGDNVDDGHDADIIRAAALDALGRPVGDALTGR